jgi:glycosyltransferase involved in cell wall biosynthesis
MKISIVTNAYNQGQFLAEAMESVLSQDWPDVEYIVVDPGSTDNTPEVIAEFQKKYPGRIIHIAERDNGPADGLNRGFARANGELFSYLNADDFYLPGCFRAAVNAAQRYPNAAAIYGDGYEADAKGVVSRSIISSTPFSPRRFVYGGCFALQQSTFYRAEAFRAVNGFNVENKTSWDGEILVDMALKNMQLVHIPAYWSVFRIYGESLTGSQRLAVQARANHDRLFRMVTGRPKTELDRFAAKFVRVWSVLNQPRSVASQIRSRLGMVKKATPSM